jgi:predicted amidohydrolase
LGGYRKIHLFDARVDDTTATYRESDDYRPGAQSCVMDAAVGRVGVAVCYDLRFHSLFQAMLNVGVDVIVVPSAFTLSTGLAHWLPLLRARAIECQYLIVGANQGGDHAGGRQTSGGSAVIDAWGTVLAEAGFGEALVMAEWDATAQKTIRQRMPVREHRRHLD